jgi:hypothetical protein
MPMNKTAVTWAKIRVPISSASMVVLMWILHSETVQGGRSLVDCGLGERLSAGR